MRLAVIVNPHAGQNRRERERVPRLREIVGDRGEVFEPASLEELSELSARLAHDPPGVLAVCGGDGSFFRTLSCLIAARPGSALPLFLPLPAGSMNTVARSVGLPGASPEKVLSRVVGALRQGRPLPTTERHLIRVGPDQYGFMVGAGVIVNFLQVYYARPGRGPIAAARLFGRGLLSGIFRTRLTRGLLQGFDADVTCDDDRVPHRRYNVLYASTIEDIGLGFRATYLAHRKRGFFHLLAGTVSPLQVAVRLARLRHGCPLGIPSLYDNLAREVRVEFARPTPYMIDGDVLEPVNCLELATGPRLSVVIRV